MVIPIRVRCKTCRVHLTKSNGYAITSARTGNLLFQPRCRRCDRSRMRRYKARNREHINEVRRRNYQENSGLRRRVWATNLFRRTGVSAESYEARFRGQKRRCAVCRRKLTRGRYGSSRACQDHCHITNLARGIVCHRCNIFLGMLDVPGLLKTALDYLDGYKKDHQANRRPAT